MIAKTPKVRKEGIRLARQVARTLPPKVRSVWYSKVKQLVATAGKVYSGIKTGLRAADNFLGAMGIHNANQRIQNYLLEQLNNAAHGIGRAFAWGAPAFVGTLAPLLLNQRPMYDHPIGPPNQNENIMGINFNGHY